MLKAGLIESLSAVVGADAVLTRVEDVVPYSFDGTAALKTRPSAVVFPQTTAQVAECVKLAAAGGTPIVTRGSGTGLSGGSVPAPGSLVLCLTKMDAILDVDPRNLTLTAQPGAITQRIDEAAGRHGLFYPPDPGSLRISTIGGNVAENSGGLRGLKYGVTRDYVMGLEVVLADGRVARLGNRCVKDVAGYSLKDLFVGSEGTLGIITEITLKLHGIPEAIAAGVCPFPSVKAACDATILTIQTGLPVARIELLDDVMIRGVNLHSKLGLPETTMLFVEFHGTEDGVKEQSERFGEIAAEFGGGPFEWATKAEDRSKLWQARHDAYWAARALRPGFESVATDVCVPISQLAECVEETKRDIQASGLIAPIAGHVGDGNFHTQPVVDLNDADEVERAQAFIDRLVKRALAMGGTCTGEHGVGQKKIKYLELEHGAEALAVMRTLKRALDPRNILNPGKIIVL